MLIWWIAVACIVVNAALMLTNALTYRRLGLLYKQLEGEYRLLLSMELPPPPSPK